MSVDDNHKIERRFILGRDTGWRENARWQGESSVEEPVYFDRILFVCSGSAAGERRVPGGVRGPDIDANWLDFARPGNLYARTGDRLFRLHGRSLKSLARALPAYFMPATARVLYDFWRVSHFDRAAGRIGVPVLPRKNRGEPCEWILLSKDGRRRLNRKLREVEAWQRAYEKPKECREPPEKEADRYDSCLETEHARFFAVGSDPKSRTNDEREGDTNKKRT